jgi:hypothetical protein
VARSELRKPPRAAPYRVRIAKDLGGSEMPDGSPNGQHPDHRRKPDSLGRAWKALKAAKLLILFVALGLAVGVLAAYMNTLCHNSGFGSSCSSALMTLATGLIISGALKLLLDSYQDSKKERDEQHELRERLLEEMRDVYLRVERARLMIKAHNSAKAYNHQMSQLIGCQATLLRVRRTLNLRLDDKNAQKNKYCFADIIGYLRALQNEFESNYNEIADSKNSCAVTKLPVVHDLTGCGDHFRFMLVGPLGVLAARIVEKDLPELAKDPVRLAETIPELDKEFEDLVKDRAKKVQDDIVKESREQAAVSCLSATATSQAN